MAGRLTKYGEELNGQAEITFRERQTAELRKLCIDRVMNCTGQGMGTHLFKTPFFKSLLVC